MQGDLKLVNINDERFWDILFNEAYVEGQQATRIRSELEKIIAYDVENVVAELEEEMNDAKRLWDNDEYYTGLANGYEGAIDVVRNGGKE